jgi:hypothetical protein
MVRSRAPPRYIAQSGGLVGLGVRVVVGMAAAVAMVGEREMVVVPVAPVVPARARALVVLTGLTAQALEKVEAAMPRWLQRRQRNTLPFSLRISAQIGR